MAAVPRNDTFMYAPRLLLLQAEVVERLVKAQELTYHRRKNLAYFDACVHANFNVVEVLEVLLSVLAGDAGLKIDRVSVCRVLHAGSCDNATSCAACWWPSTRSRLT